MHYFIRLNGELLEVHPMTKPNTENPSVRVRIIRTDSIRRVLATEIITD